MIPLLRQTSLQHKHLYCNICLPTIAKCVAGVLNVLHFPRRPASNMRSLYCANQSSVPLHGSSYFLFPKLLGHSFVHPSLAGAAVRVAEPSPPDTQPPPAPAERGQRRPHGTYEQQRTQSVLQAVIGRCGGDNLPRPSVGQSTLHPPYLQIDRS